MRKPEPTRLNGEIEGEFKREGEGRLRRLGGAGGILVGKRKLIRIVAVDERELKRA